MIHVVTLDNQHLYARQLDQMFRMRHEYYVEGHGWAGLTPQNGRETDEFDNEQAVYLLGLDPEGNVAASIRLNPTTGPTLLGKFADHCETTLPVGPAIWDASRWFAHPKHRRAENPRWPTNHQRELILGLLEFGVSRGAVAVTMLIEQRLAERIAAYGWPMRYLGTPRPYENGKGVAVAAEIGLGEDILALVRAKTGVKRAVLIEAGAASTPAPLTEVRALVEDMGPDRVAALLARLFDHLAEIDEVTWPVRAEMLGSLLRIAGLEASAAPVASRLQSAHPPAHRASALQAS